MAFVRSASGWYCRARCAWPQGWPAVHRRAPSLQEVAAPAGRTLGAALVEQCSKPCPVPTSLASEPPAHLLKLDLSCFQSSVSNNCKRSTHLLKLNLDVGGGVGRLRGAGRGKVRGAAACAWIQCKPACNARAGHSARSLSSPCFLPLTRLRPRHRERARLPGCAMAAAAQPSHPRTQERKPLRPFRRRPCRPLQQPSAAPSQGTRSA